MRTHLRVNNPLHLAQAIPRICEKRVALSTRSSRRRSAGLRFIQKSRSSGEKQASFPSSCTGTLRAGRTLQAGMVPGLTREPYKATSLLLSENFEQLSFGAGRVW